MKITKRIIVAVLALAILVSCFAFAASAEEQFENAGKYGINSVEGILEYYDLADYLSDNYETGVYNKDLYSGTAPSIVDDPTDPANKVLKVGLPTKGGSASYGNKSSTDKLIVSYRVYFESNAAGNFSYKLNVKRVNVEGVEDPTYSTILSVDFRNQLTKTTVGEDGVETTEKVVDENGNPVYGFKYSVWDPTGNNGAGAFRETVFDKVNPETGKWYDIVIFFNAGAGSYNFKISDNGGDSWHESESISLGNTARMSSFQLLTADKARKSVTFYLDDVEIYCGTFERNPANKNNITAATLLDLDKLYNEAEDYESKLRIADVFYKLTYAHKYGYTPDPVNTPEIEKVNAVMEKIPEYVNSVFASKFLSEVDKIDASAGYYDRVAQAELIEYYNGALPVGEAAGIDAQTAEDIAAKRVLYQAELDEIAIIKDHSDKFIAHMFSYEEDNKNYDGYLKNFYEYTVELNKRDDTYNELVAGCGDFTMADALETFAGYNARIEKMLKAVNTFIDGVVKMETAVEGVEDLPGAGVAEWFGDLYEGYEIALGVYNGGVIDETLDNSTHAELVVKMAKYLELEPYILDEKKDCDEFNAIMKKAETATYYTTIIDYLEEAAPYYDIVQTGYYGVEYSKALYDKLTKAMSDNEDASKAYINAVNAIAEAETFVDKWAAVEAARALKAEGDVLGVAGVKEANVIFSIATGEIDFLVNNSNTLITLVNSLEGKTSLAERRAIIRQALAIQPNAEPTFEGVEDAKNALNEYVEAFEAEVAALNAAMNAATENALSVSGGSARDTSVYKFINIIRDLLNR